MRWWILVERRYHEFIGENPLLTERMWRLIWEIDRVEEIHMRHLGILDILCWDVKSQHAKMPIYQMLGGDDRVVPAYASTVTWPTMGEYERYIKMSRDLGFKAFKLHAWGGPVKRDIELCTNLRKWVGDDADLMFDGSAGWDYVNALEFGKAIRGPGFLLVRGADARVPSRRLHQALRKARYPDPRRRNLGWRAWQHGDLDREQGARHGARLVASTKAASPAR